jgi:hypothetical protein
MSIGQGYVYVQFHPFVYMVKLHIELNMAGLITKIVRDDNGGSHNSGSGPTGGRSFGRPDADPRGLRMTTLVTANQDYHKHNDDHEGINAKPMIGITKTVETEIQHMDDDSSSRSSSTAELQHGICSTDHELQGGKGGRAK